jgi:hypothetical protein
MFLLQPAQWLAFSVTVASRMWLFIHTTHVSRSPSHVSRVLVACHMWATASRQCDRVWTFMSVVSNNKKLAYTFRENSQNTAYWFRTTAGKIRLKCAQICPVVHFATRESLKTFLFAKLFNFCTFYWDFLLIKWPPALIYKIAYVVQYSSRSCM